MHPPRIPHAPIRMSTLFLSPLHRPTPTCLPFLLFSPLQPSRSATHASEGRANKASQGPGKRLGAKRGASEHVVPGNIIFRQRGTHWFPGENCGMGRDHTIFAKEKGYVVYYREKWRNKMGERKFIGVVFERGMTLPRNPGAKRMRRLGLVGRDRDMSTLAETAGEGEDGIGAWGRSTVTGVARDGLTSAGVGSTLGQQTRRKKMRVPQSQMKLRAGYQYRESNWSIGRAAERAGVKIREYKRGDRWLAWRKKVAAKERSREKRAMGGKKKSKK